jgi:hypothetical protein
VSLIYFLDVFVGLFFIQEDFNEIGKEQYALRGKGR